MRKLILLMCILFAMSSYAQTTFMAQAGTTGDDEIYGIVQSSDGSFVATGWSNYNDGNGNIFLLKLNSSGQQLWSKTIGTQNYDEGFGITNTSDGGFAVSGSIGNKMGISKFDASGNLTWAKQYQDQVVYSDASRLLQTSDGGYLLPGGISNDNFSTSQSYLIKTDASGNVQWSKKYFNSSYSIIYDIKKSSDNNYIFLALNYDNAGGDSAYVVKINSSGSVLWCRYLTSDNEYVDGYGLTTTSDGGLIVTGEAYYSYDNAFIAKIDGNGNYKWSKSTNFSNDAIAQFYDAKELSDGSYVAIGYYNDFNTDYPSLFLVKLSNSGSLIWTKLLNASDGSNAVKTSDGGYAIVGSLYNNNSSVPEIGSVTKLDANFNGCAASTTGGTLIDFGSFSTGAAPAYTGNTVSTPITPSITSVGSTANICSALPLSLINFNASLQGNFVNLQWKTSQEINTSYFDIEKSIDAKVFTSFARVTAAGNSNMIKSYTTSDNNPSKGDNWYRLKMVDKDGVFAYSNQVKVNNGSNGPIYLYPNPALSHAELYFNSNNTCNYVLKITDMSGKTLQTLTGKFILGDNIIHLDAGSLARGLYLVSVVAEGQPKVVLKLNKQ